MTFREKMRGRMRMRMRMRKREIERKRKKEKIEANFYLTLIRYYFFMDLKFEKEYSSGITLLIVDN